MSMRNLSKVLALVLSLAFVLTMFAGAITDKGIKKYADEAELSAAGGEAVAVLTALQITEGYPDGTFRGADNVSRAEYAKMLSVAVAGTDVENFYNVTAMTDFSDEIDAWAIPYLNYAYLNQIMVGYGDGTIRPKSDVTGFEAVKMALVGLGYDPKIEGLEGAAWQSNTARLANKIGLLKNLQSENLYDAFDREANAILIRNAIYTETVSYVGSSAVGSGMTLGEKVFDLIDVRGIIVANDQGAIGLNWIDVLTTATTKDAGSFIQYEVAPSGMTRFAYRDYSEAASVGGYYVPRVITAAIDSDKAELGRAYRVLATGAKNPANTNEVRKVYGVLGEIESDNSYTIKRDEKFSADVVKAMLASAKTINPLVDADAVQKNIYLNGKAVSYQEAIDAAGKINGATTPYYMVDNDGDGIYDFLYLFTMQAVKVTAAGDGKITLAGIGTKSVLSSLEGIEAGDYVAYWTDGQFGWVKELETYTGKVTAYTKNSGDRPWTYRDGTYTINGKNYTFGSLADSLGADEREYFEQLMGYGSAAVADATLDFVFDGSFIVAAFVNAKETHWDNYAVVIGYDWDTYLGMRHVRLYTEDNEYKDFYVASLNGQQIYNNIVNWGDAYTLAGRVNTLVRYEELGNNQIALYDASYANASSLYQQVGMFYDSTTGMWEAQEFFQSGIQNGTLYNWKNGVVFVSYGTLLDNAYPETTSGDPANVLNGSILNCGAAYQWRAYYYGEFQPASEFEADAPYAFMRKAGPDEVVYANALNNVRTLKAAAIVFDGNSGLFVLPGLPLRAGQAIWGTIMSATNITTVTDEATTKYAFQVEILKPWNGGKEKITVYSDVKLVTFLTGNIYKLFIDKDGICRRWELAASAGNTYDTFGSDYLELGKYVITGVIDNGDGSYWLKVKKPTGTGLFYAVEDKLYLPAGADVYFVKNLFKASIAAADDVTAYGYLGQLSFANHKAYNMYVDLNPSNNNILSAWIDTTGTADYSIEATIEVKYNTNTKKAYYTIDPAATGAYFAGGKTTLEVTAEPYELRAPIGDAVEVTLALTYDLNTGAWYIEGDKAIGGYTWVKYDKSNTRGVIYTPGDKLEIITPGFSMNDLPKYYKLDNTSTADTSMTQGFWKCIGLYDDQYPIYGDTSINYPTGQYFFKDSNSAEGDFAAPTSWDEALAYNPDGFKDDAVDAYNYEAFYVMYNNVKTDTGLSGAPEKYADANIIVYVEENPTITALNGSSIVFPYKP